MQTTDEPLLESFRRDGFVVLPGFFAGAALEELARNVERFLVDVLPGLPPEHVFYENRHEPGSLKQIQQLAQHDEWFDSLCSSGALRTVAEQLLGGPASPRNIQYFDKPPGVGKPTPPHQDGFYFMLDPCEAVTMWVALDGADEENGCVRYVRGSHRRGMRRHARTRTLGFSQSMVDYPAEQDAESEVALHARPGDLLVHHAMTIHRADGNRSQTRHRRALGLIYYSEEAREDRAAHAEYQRALAEEWKAEGKI